MHSDCAEEVLQRADAQASAPPNPLETNSLHYFLTVNYIHSSFMWCGTHSNPLMKLLLCVQLCALYRV